MEFITLLKEKTLREKHTDKTSNFCAPHKDTYNY